MDARGYLMNRIGLKDAIEALRVELGESVLVSEGKEVRFEVGEIEMEFQVAVEQTTEGKGGIKFWVVELGANVADKTSNSHKIKIPLKPVWKDGSPIKTGSKVIPE
jgi:Trypsin-co-occurring domain 2